jgi:hypothetical protein
MFGQVSSGLAMLSQVRQGYATLEYFSTYLVRLGDVRSG